MSLKEFPTKERYENAEIELINLKAEEVIRTSIDPEPGEGEDDDDF